MRKLRVPSASTLVVLTALLVAALYGFWPSLRTWAVLRDLPADYAGCATRMHDLTRAGRYSPLVLESTALKAEAPRRARVWCLITLRDLQKGETGRLRGLVRDPDPDVALCAATLLAFRANDEGAPLLFTNLREAAPGDAAHLQFEAARGLFHLGYGSRVVGAHYERMAGGDASARAFLLGLMQMAGGDARAAAQALGGDDAPEGELLLWWRDTGLEREWDMPCDTCFGEVR